MKFTIHYHHFIASHLPQLLAHFGSNDSLFLALEWIPNLFLQWRRKVVETVSMASDLEPRSLDMFISRDSHNQCWPVSDLENSAQLYGTGVKLSCAQQSEGGILDAVFISCKDKIAGSIFRCL
jgi:hypothetical protein